MGRLAAEYFTRRDVIRQTGAAAGAVCGDSGNSPDPAGIDGEAANLLLKEAFRTFCSAAASRRLHEHGQLEELYLQQLRVIIP
jgi:hypothetical protein